MEEFTGAVLHMVHCYVTDFLILLMYL